MSQTPSIFERFSDRARHTIARARDEALRKHHDYIGTEHLLLSLLRQKNGVAATILEKLGVNQEQALGELDQSIAPSMGQTPDPLPFSPRAKKALEAAIDEARTLQCEYIGTEHLLLGIARDGETVASRFIAALPNLTLDRMRSALSEIYAANQAQQSEAASGPETATSLEELNKRATFESLAAAPPGSPAPPLPSPVNRPWPVIVYIPGKAGRSDPSCRIGEQTMSLYRGNRLTDFLIAHVKHAPGAEKLIQRHYLSSYMCGWAFFGGLCLFIAALIARNAQELQPFLLICGLFGMGVAYLYSRDASHCLMVLIERYNAWIKTHPNAAAAVAAEPQASTQNRTP